MTIDGPGVGTTWQGEYLLQATLGDPERGVFRAQRRSDSQIVALRLWRAQSDAQANEFLETALSACGVRHAALAHVDATGREAEHCYIVAEYVVGQKLDTWADHVGIPPLPQVVELMRRICDGLSVAADSKLVHTALHPRNIAMLPAEAANDRTLHPKLLDLGVPIWARARSIHPLSAQFMAPEQLEVALEPSAPILPDTTSAMNVYSCGALLYFLCTGGPPFRQVELSALRQAHREGRLAVPSRINPQITPSLNAVIVQALAQDPAQRFGSMAALGAALANVTLTLSAPAMRPVASIAPPPPAAGRKRPSGAFARASVPPGASRRAPAPPPDEFDIEGDTAKTERPGPSPSGRPAAVWSPAPMGKASAVARWSEPAAAPVGSFSSAPPPPAPSRPPQAIIATPVALFSNDPRMRAEPSVIVARFDPSASALLAPEEEAIESPAPRQALTFGVLYGILAVVACLGTFAAVRLIRSPQPPQGPTPVVTVENAATRPVSSPPAENVAPAPAPATDVPAASVAVEPAETAAPAPPELAPHEPVAHLEHARHPLLDEAAQARGMRARGLRGAAPSAIHPEARAAPVVAVAATTDTEPTHEAQPEPSVRSEEPPPAAPAVPPVDETLLQLKPMPQENEPREARFTVPLVPFEPPRPTTAKPTLFAAKAEVGDIVLRGSIPTSKIRRAIERVRPQLSACYGRSAALAGRNQYGVVEVELEIDERGRVRSPHARGAGLPGLNGCVAQAAGDVISEVPDTGIVRVSFQVTFSP